MTREEFDVQREVLARARDKLAALESRIAELESRLRRTQVPALISRCTKKSDQLFC